MRVLAHIVVIAALLLPCSSLAASAAPKAEETLRFYYQDHLSSTALVTDTTGSIVETIDYYPYGETKTDETTTSFLSSNRFTGKNLDEMTSLYYFEKRFYDPAVGVFLSQDSLFQGDISKKVQQNSRVIHPYAYCFGNPIKLVDVGGNWPSLSSLGQAAANFANAVNKTESAVRNSIVTVSALAAAGMIYGADRIAKVDPKRDQGLNTCMNVFKVAGSMMASDIESASRSTSVFFPNLTGMKMGSGGSWGAVSAFSPNLLNAVKPDQYRVETTARVNDFETPTPKRLV